MKHVTLIPVFAALLLLLAACSTSAAQGPTSASAPSAAQAGISAGEQASGAETDAAADPSGSSEAAAGDTAATDGAGAADDGRAAAAADTGDGEDTVTAEAGDAAAAADTGNIEAADTTGTGDTAATADSPSGAAASTFTYGGITTLSPSDEALAEREELQSHPWNFIWKQFAFPYTMLKLRSNDTQEFPDQWTASGKEHTVYGSNDVYMLGDDDPDCYILYIHGGGYAYSAYGKDSIADQVTLCDKLALVLHARVYIPLYTLTPRGKWKDAYLLLDQIYADLEATGKPVYLLGDSAGGGSALAYTMLRRDRGDALPEKLILISPWLDLTLSNPEIADYEEKDCILSPFALRQFGKFWADTLSTTDPLVSPIYGNLGNLPPVLLITGTEEIMYPDCKALYQKLTAAGSSVSMVQGEQLWHDFACSQIPESEKCIDIISEFCSLQQP